MNHTHRHSAGSRGRRTALATSTLAAAACLVGLGRGPVGQQGSAAPGVSGADASGASGAGALPQGKSLEETRLTMTKWLEMQQLVSKERNDWLQGKEILIGRIELVKREIAGLEEKIQEARAEVAKADAARDELRGQNEGLVATGDQLTAAVSLTEREVLRLFAGLPEPLQTRLQPLHQRIPVDPASTRVSAAERFQNVLGILNEVNKANTEITVTYEVRELAGGRPSEVRVVYVGLGHAYYVSAGGESGVGRPAESGWQWEPSPAVSADVLEVLEIIQGKQTPAFVPLPMRIQ